MSESFLPPPLFPDSQGVQITILSNDVVDPSPVHISHDQYPDQLVPKESTEQHTSSNENRTHAIATTDADSEAEAGSGTGAYKTEDVVSNAQDERSANTLSPEQHVFEDAFQNQAATGNRLPTHEPNMPDLVTSIRGMYRILDLINEQGSGGLVDKVIISQESLGKFMNDLQPGSYISITKVDFAVLDNIGVKPIGIYGSKTEIIRFLESVDAVGNATAHALRAETSQSLSAVRPVLRSGLYILRVPQGGVEDGAEVLYAIYWPEDTTWEYNPPSTAERNRVTFMRYLTKIADQLVALISDDDAGKIIWKGDDDDVAPHDLDEDEDEDDRMFIFKVTKLHEQEENVTSRPGWTIEVPSFPSSPPPNISDNFASLPCLIHGEERQGLLHAVFVPARRISKALDEVFTESRLRSLIKDKSFRLDHDISVASIEILLSLGLVERAPAASKAYRSRVDEIQCRAKESGTAQEKQIQTKLKENADRLQRALRDMCIQHIIRKYPAVDPLSLAEPSTQDSSDSTDVGTQHGHDALDDLSKLHPGIRDVLADAEKDHQWQSVRTPQMKKYKERILLLDFMFQDLGNAHATRDEMAELINAVINQGDTKTMAEVVKSSDGSNQSFFAKTLSFFFGTDVAKDRITQAENYAADVSYAVFLSSLDSIVEREPLLFDAALETKRLAHETLKRNVNTQMHKLMARIQKLQEDALKPQIWHDVNSQRDHDIELARTEFVQAVYDSFVSTTGRTFYLINTVTKASRYISFHSWAVSGSSEEYSESALRYTIRPILLTEEDGNRLKLDPSFIPTPRVPSYAAASFELPLEKHISHIQALPNNRCLLIVDDRRSTVKVYLEPLLSLAHALEHHNAEKKLLSREKIGEQCIFAFNEAKRMLAVLGISQAEHRVELHIFVFDENYTTLKGLGSAVKLNPWYDNAVTITHATFVCGSEELALVDDRARVRIFSIVTQQFRPAFQQLDSVPDAIYSSPDGACLLSLHTVAGTSVMRVYHWSTFGSSGGISVGLNELNTNDCVVTSLCRRTNVHVVSLDADSGRCASLALDITRKATEFAFRGEKEGVAQSTQTEAARNCFLDCHVDVWRRFPVISAIRRQTISSSSRRKSRTLVCVTSLDQAAYAPYFANCISSFEKATQKPTGTELSGIEATALRYEAFASRTDLGGDVSCFRAGEWLADILCLIPIQIAVARENRFIPIKDGVFSNDLERSLLGADVARIIDSLSIGWYESLFRSYMAHKQVKVVSSMGEQSVGKSFALNHLVDTSFAGSAMRTTEGVWMSVAPLDDMIIVALDFEGVHSIERSAQEDTLLVLFNTAISNLVLFRNNFALSRDITGLFKSFQSSSSILDPDANPTLFCSTLVIIIKDVVEPDAKDVVKEFSLKFEQIVEQEQGANFISQLHDGNLAIVPWPVIESRQFYTLFGRMKRLLEKQKPTHPNGSVFLQTLKTLMAKLKSNDWGALSQTMTAHRAQLLLTLLPNALAFGATEVTPEFEPLKDLDTNILITEPDTTSRFFVTELIDREGMIQRDDALATVIRSWHNFAKRPEIPEQEWIEDLTSFLDRTVEKRIGAVQEWISMNTKRCPADHADMQSLQRAARSMIIDLKSNVQVCTLQCAECQLSCILRRHHEGGHSCQTSHKCLLNCEYEERDVEPCGLPAGHPGTHICHITAHLCGKPCELRGKRGCLKECSKVVGHSDEQHICVASVHECGEPCSLNDVRIPGTGGQHFSCPELCRIPSHEPHDRHICDTRQCPIQCQLCKRLCADGDHLHALQGEALHLCGQEHACDALCAAPGLCYIETTPQSVEATFTGRHETFQYTKYTQVSKRLQCVIPIVPGRIDHLDTGPHSHSLDPDPFHFCKAKCDNCGYFCTLRLGHTQQEHDTNHGSMSSTQWAIAGPDGTTVELDGRKFGSGDEGAPMLCSIYCRSMGRHVHVDYCRTELGVKCEGQDYEHITTQMNPHPERSKDWVNHSLYWRRTGFKDPYSHEEQADFALCDAMCSGPEHDIQTNTTARPSLCTLPVLHRHTMGQPVNDVGYISNDGHAFNCRNPAVMQESFHVIFVIDKSGSMRSGDQRPLPDTPAAATIRGRHNNRLGAVYSSLYTFWAARGNAANMGQPHAIRRDAYTVLLFNEAVSECLEYDFASTPERLLDSVLSYSAGGDTNFTVAIRRAQSMMERHWSNERSPVVIFLSDGESSIADVTMQNICLRSIALGKPLSFHTVAFGPRSAVLQRMANVAIDVQGRAPPDRQHPASPSTYSEALDNVRLAETFLGIAESLRKPRGSLFLGKTGFS